MKVEFEDAEIHTEMAEALMKALGSYKTWVIKGFTVDDESGHRRITLDIVGWQKSSGKEA